jgi:hypothetical protein
MTTFAPVAGHALTLDRFAQRLAYERFQPLPGLISRVNSSSVGNSSTAATPYSVTVGVACNAGDVIVVCAAGNGTHVGNGMSVQDNRNAVPFTTILETQGGSASSRWLQTFIYQTPQALLSGDLITLTPYALSSANSFSVEVFRAATVTIDQAAVGNSNPLAAISVAPSLPGLPKAGSLVLSFAMCGSGTLAPQGPLVKGSAQTANNATAIGYVLSADPNTGYPSTWALGTANTSAAQTVALTAAAGGTTPIALTDAAAGSDDIAVVAATPLADTAAASDATAVTVSVALTDAGSASDTILVGFGIALTESGAGSDAITVTAATPLADTGSAADTLAANATVPLADAASAAQAVTATATVPISDSASTSESLAAGVPIGVTETGSAAEALTLTITVALADAGSSADSRSVAAAVPLADTGSGADQLNVLVSLALAEAASAADALGVVRVAVLADAGAASDAVTVQQQTGSNVALADSGTAFDRICAVLHRPTTGTTTRPAAGATTRPTTGTTTRPSGGTTTRPDSGITYRG